MASDDYVPIEVDTLHQGRHAVVSVPLSEIQRIRDELANIRHYHFVIRRLHGQVAGLYQRLLPQAKAAMPQETS